jgi:hypothetical protein
MIDSLAEGAEEAKEAEKADYLVYYILCTLVEVHVEVHFTTCSSRNVAASTFGR